MRPVRSIIVDILVRLGEAFRYEDLQWEIREIDGVAIRVATPETLLKMKTGTLRPKDRLDAAMLREHFGIREDKGGR